jgi:LuxR family transcriptional regulator, maltose regulon positive regulatory protein
MAVLRTKLHVPAARHRLIERPRLSARLDRESATPRLLLVSAPAGFGKTTFLTQWLDDHPDVGVAWLSLDAGDNDPRRFLTALATSLHTAAAPVGEGALALLDTSSQLPTDSVLISLVNDLDLQAATSVIILDDYHLIEDPVVHEVTAFLLEHLPAHVTLAISSRLDPPLPLAKLRSRGELAEVRADELRFTPGEASSFLTQVMGLDLSESDVAALEARTEGWAAGLQLAGLSMRGQDDPRAFIDAFAGSHRFVVDYLLEEVLRRQPDDVTQFLLDTAVLAQMSGPLCDAVTGRHDSQQMLETLERSNMFLIPLDEQRRWYRYHHLFADALRARSSSGDPSHARDLHRRASTWFAAHDEPEEAIRHALAAGDPERAGDLIEQALPENRRHRGDRTLRSWLEKVPAPLVRQRPVLSTFVAYTRFIDGDLEGAAALLDDAESALGAMPSDTMARATHANPELGRLRGTIEVYRAALAQARGDIDGTAHHARRALESAGPQDHLARSGGAGFLALAAWADGDLETAVDTFDQTVAALHAAGFLADELGTSIPRASMWVGRGRPDTAMRLLEDALGVATRQPATLSSTGDLHVALADILREHDELDAAEDHLQTAHEVGDAASLLENRHRWYLTKAGVEAARGRLDAAATLVEQGQTLHLSGFYPDVRPIPAILARIRIAQGRLDDALAWARDHDVDRYQPPQYRHEYNQLTLARLQIARGREQTGRAGLAHVLRLLDRLLPVAESQHRAASVIEIHLLAALVHHVHGDVAAALDRLVLALALGVPVGYRRLFLDEGAPMAELLRMAQQQRPDCGEHVRQLQHSAAGLEAAAPQSPAGEELSERELEVLRLLVTTLTGPDISRQLYMSVNTFRTHTKHIFTKLDVNTRAAAVRRAQGLGLL